MNRFATFFLIAGLLIGCDSQSVLSPEGRTFEATPVSLSAEAQEELVLTETIQTTQDFVPEATSVEDSVTLVSSLTTYRRAPALQNPSPVQAAVARQNPSGLTGGAIAVSAADLDVDEVDVPFLEGSPTISSDQMGLILPSGARQDGEVTPAEGIAVFPATAVGDSAVMDWPTPDNFYDVPDGTAFLQAGNPFGLPGDGGEAFTAILGTVLLPDVSGELLPGESFRVIAPDAAPFGTLDLPSQTIEDGETVGTENAVFVVPGSVVASTDGSGAFSQPIPPSVMNEGRPVPLGGGTYELTVITTPKAEVEGQPVNPFLTEDVDELLDPNNPDTVYDLLPDDVSEPLPLWYSESEWIAGPHELTSGGNNPFLTLGGEAETKTFGGVVASGEEGQRLFAVAIHVARTEDEDRGVIALGVHRTPVATGDYPWLDLLENGGTAGPWPPYWLEGGAALTAAALEPLARAHPPGWSDWKISDPAGDGMQDYEVNYRGQ